MQSFILKPEKAKAMKTTIVFLASDPVIRRVICKALESKGYFVVPARDVGTAADYLREFGPDLLIVRHYTEGVSGHEAAVYLRQIQPGIPVLLLGGLIDDDDLENRERLERFEIFPKPFKASELFDKVEEVLKDAAQNKAAGNPK